MNLSKEEIEKAKKEITGIINLFYEFPNPQSVLLQDSQVKYLETLLQYIEELEESNRDLYHDNKKIEFERDMANKMIDEILRYFAPNFDCPLDRENIDLDCENRCNSNNDNLEAECWKKYFERR